MEDTTILEVFNLWLSIKSANNGEFLSSAGGDSHVLSNFQVSTLQINVKGFSTIKSMSVSTLSCLKLHWQDSHSNQVGSVNSLVALSNDGLDSLQVWSLSSPIS
jgi:hypothetical protein